MQLSFVVNDRVKVTAWLKVATNTQPMSLHDPQNTVGCQVTQASETPEIR
jgi:hypothetical protein